ncbi:solute carrier family 35 member B1 homolog [Aedes albopictus]|uniref:Udp-galactose transporter related protein n=1 Tax=Aedes albopictus TaxID=7160 RepID=A0ABM1YHK7_AEDAL
MRNQSDLEEGRDSWDTDRSQQFLNEQTESLNVQQGVTEPQILHGDVQQQQFQNQQGQLDMQQTKLIMPTECEASHHQTCVPSGEPPDACQQIDKTSTCGMPCNKKAIIAALGIFVCYFCFGIIQEKITRGRYGDEPQEDGTRGEQFTYAQALVGVQFICNWVLAKAILIARPQNLDTTPKRYYASGALTYLLAMVSSNMALRWVSYPMQVVVKSAKPIPVMLLSFMFGRKSYTLQKYMFVLLIVIGVVLFMLKEGKTNSSPLEREGLGQLLLGISLIMDGLMGAVQERMRQHSSPSALQMMLAINGWSTVLLIPPLFITGEAMDFVVFATKYPQMLGHLATLALAGVIGQLFIFMMISSFGSLACSLCTTTRKFFTVLCSVLLFGNNLSIRQWMGTVLVFTGLFADMFFGKKGASASGKSPPKSKEKSEANGILK